MGSGISISLRQCWLDVPKVSDGSCRCHHHLCEVEFRHIHSGDRMSAITLNHPFTCAEFLLFAKTKKKEKEKENMFSRELSPGTCVASLSKLK